MTYASELGLKVGSKIRVLEANIYFSRNEIITLVEDDGTFCPYFESDKGICMSPFSLERKWEHYKETRLVWKEMTLDEVKAVQVGDKIRIDGVEGEVAYLYNRANDDYGFKCYKNHNGSTTISDSMVAEMQCKFEKLVEEEMNTGLERDKEYDVKLTGEEIALVNMVLSNCTGNHLTSVWRKFYSLVGHNPIEIGTIYLHKINDAVDNYLDKVFPKIETEDQRKLRELKEKHAELGKAIEAMEKK